MCPVCRTWKQWPRSVFSSVWTGSPQFAYRIMVYQNLNKTTTKTEISCQISAVYDQLHVSAKTSMCIQHCFWMLKSQYDRSPAKFNFHRNQASNHERQIFSCNSFSWSSDHKWRSTRNWFYIDCHYQNLKMLTWKGCVRASWECKSPQ